MTAPANYATLGVKVNVLQTEMTEVKTTVGLLSGKIDTAVGDLGREMRRAIEALGSNINERSRTPWAVIWAGLSVLIVLMGFIANQTLAPITTELATLRSTSVPRSEHLVRDENMNRRLNELEDHARRVDERRYIEVTKQLDRLLDQNSNSEQLHLKDMQDQINKGFARNHEELVKENERLAGEVLQLRRDLLLTRPAP